MFIEEATELTESDWNQLQLRIRGRHKNYVQFILAFNPISEESWLNKVFWDNTEEDVMTLVTTYKDNYYLSKEDIYHFEERVRKNAQYWRVYGLGEWGSIQTGDEIVHKFNYTKHVLNLEYNPNLPLHISVDFNVQPHCSMGVFQISNGKIKCIDEIALEHPFNRTKDMSLEFLKKYYNHRGGLFIYGDVAGMHNDTRTETGANDYSIIMKELKEFRPQLKVGLKAPSVVMSTNFLNSILGDETDLSLIIDINCKKMINDLLYLKQNSEGGKQIEYEKNEKTKTRYEKYGHFFDLLRYFLTTCFAKEYQIYQVGYKPFSNVKIGGKNHNNGTPTRLTKNSY